MASTIVLVILGVIAVLIAIFAYLHSTIHQWRNMSMLPACLGSQQLQQVLLLRVPTVVKILMSYCQMIYVFDVLDSVLWPSVFMSFINYLNIALVVGVEAWLSRLLLPLSCTVGGLSAYTWLLLTLVAPLVCAVLFVALGYIATVIARRQAGDSTAGETNGANATGLVPALYTLHIWLILLLYPSLCRAIFSVFSCTQLGDKYLLNSDTSLQCWVPAQYPWIVVSVVGMVVYAIGAPLVCFLLTQRWHHESKPEHRQQLGRRLALLVRSYGDDCWWFEAADLVRKLLLTSVVLLVAPGTRVQLWFGLLVSVAATLAMVAIKPYRDPVCQGLQTAAMLQVTFDYITANVFFVEPGQPVDQEATSSFLGPLLIIVNCAAFVGLLAVLLRGTHSTLTVKPACLGDGSPALAGRPLGQFHCFVSHVWGSGQDQARVMKSQLTALVPDLRVFLDVDDLNDIGSLEALIDATDTIIIFLSGSTLANGAACSDYMMRTNCKRELRAAVEKKKPIIFVLETDPQHGGVSLDVHRRDCPPDLVHALDEHPIIPWYRVKVYLCVSMRLILQHILQTEVKIPGEMVRADLHVQGSVRESAGMSNLDGTCSLYVSPHNPGASEVGDLLTAEAQHVGFPLTITADPNVALTTGVVLVYLNNRTHDGGDALHAELTNALGAERPVLLVHEQREAHGALTFDEIINRTPHHLIDRGVYTALAIPLYEGEEHQRVCLLTMLRILKDAGSSESRVARSKQPAQSRFHGMLARLPTSVPMSRLRSLNRTRPSLAALDGAVSRRLELEMAVAPPSSRV